MLQQLRGQFDVEPYYFSNKTGEIDFALQYGTEIIPVEVKNGEGRSAPTFKNYISKHQPEYAICFSRRGYKIQHLVISYLNAIHRWHTQNRT
ncbi:MAG: hypothetical protein HFG41_09190 [Coprococcus sp.]|nr:hypothetical protein [Coprococcus sp.]